MNTTTDIWFVAFLEGKGIGIKNFDVVKFGKGNFNFEIDDEKWKTLKLEFNQSDELELRNRIEKIKNLIY